MRKSVSVTAASGEAAGERQWKKDKTKAVHVTSPPATRYSAMSALHPLRTFLRFHVCACTLVKLAHGDIEKLFGRR